MTHAIHVLPYVDMVVVMDTGRITEMGTFDDLMERKGPFAEYVQAYMIEVEEAGASSTDEGWLS